MNLHVSMHSNDPIYEQIEHQIKRKIHAKEIPPGTQMPSVRLLARELKVGIVTVKHAYDDLVQEGYLVAKTAVGYFSLPVDAAQIRKEGRRQVRTLLKEVHKIMEETGLSEDDVIKLFKDVEENNGE